MHPKHNLEKKNGSNILFPCSCWKTECEISFHDIVMRYVFIGKQLFLSVYKWLKINITFSHSDIKLESIINVYESIGLLWINHEISN